MLFLFLLQNSELVCFKYLASNVGAELGGNEHPSVSTGETIFKKWRYQHNEKLEITTER